MLVTFNVEVVLFICYTEIVRCYTFDLGKEYQNEKSCKQIPTGLYHKFSPTIRLCVLLMEIRFVPVTQKTILF